MGEAAILDRTAREAIGSACADVGDPGPADHVDGVVPGVVARPADTEQVAEVLRAAAAHGLSVVPRGRGTKLSWAVRPSERRRAARRRRARPGRRARGRGPHRRHPGGRAARRPPGGRGTWWPAPRARRDRVGRQHRGDAGHQRERAAPRRDRHRARPAHRHHRRARRRRRREGRREGRQERRRLRPRQADDRVLRHPGRDHRGRLPAAPAARRQPVGEHARRRPGPGPGARPGRAARAGRPRCGRGRVVPRTGRAPCTCCSRVARTAWRAARRPCGSLLGGAAIELPDDPAGGATYPWDTAASGDDRATCLKLTFVLSGLADVLATARETGLHVRGSAGAGVAYGALPRRLPSTTW